VRGNKWFYVLDGVEGKEYDLVNIEGELCGDEEGPIFSPDSKHFAYAAWRGEEYFFVLDGMEGKGYNRSITNPAFSPDSKHFAYTARDLKGVVVVVDGVESKGKYDYIIGPFVFDSVNRFHAIARRGNEFFSIDVEIMPGPTPAATPAP
jgi:hypothetical protein